MKKFYLHYSGLKVAEDGEVLVPKSGTVPEHYTYGCKDHDEHRIVIYKGKNYSIHRIVAEVFLNDNKPIDGKTYVVHHIDENPDNNNVENLVIMTYGEHNKLHKTGKYHTEETKHKISEAMLKKPIIGINKSTGEVKEFPSAREAERVLGINNRHIYECCRGIRKSAGGWKWEYA